jgi:dihydroflavonol-4-reductase
MKIFITGGTGFIGTHVVKRLKETSHELCCLCRPTSDVGELEKNHVVIFRGDLTDKQSLLEGMSGYDSVINLANFYEFWTGDKSVFEHVNVTGTRNVMEAAIDGGVRKVVHVSSAVVYGNTEWPVTEASQMGPKCASLYGQSKRAGDLVAWELFETGELPLVMVYPGAVLGPDDPKAAGRYVRNLLDRRLPAQVFTSSQFPFVHVGDVAEVIVRALEKERNIGEKYLVVSESMTFGEFNKLLADVSGIRLPRLSLPDSFAMFGAYLMTGLAKLTRRPPMLDMSVDQMRLMKQGMEVDGTKAAEELGFTYMPIRAALEEQVNEWRQGLSKAAS